MTLLVLGLALFMIPHVLSLAGDLKPRLKAMLGASRYKLVHAALSAAGLVLMVIGYQRAPVEPLYAPFSAPMAALSLMPLAFILLAGAKMRSNIKRYVRHPMSLGVLIWAVTHLSVRGDVASVLLFGGFALFALKNLLTSPTPPQPPEAPRSADVATVVAGLAAFAVVLWLHGAIGGAPVVH